MIRRTQRELPDRRRFLLRNLLRGFLWLAVIVIAFIYARKNYDFTLETVLGPVYDRPTIVYFIFLASEVIFGIIPPEFFMIWSLRSEVLSNYISNIIALSAISYVAGIIGFGIGAYLKNTRFYRIMKIRVFGKFEKHLNNYGGFLVVVASLTPLPFSGIAMLVGSVHYSFKKYLWFSLFRFLRFLAYGIVIWEANIF
ncbi:VTT domain-containing protein [Ekhidna sp.]|uniref:VTT domain-containing protein n=1 Tax=Ekhidna sp. TaxID=2608089 RepID=UPI003C79FF47